MWNSLKILFLILFLSNISIGQEFEYVLGTDFYPAPAISKPAKGEPAKGESYLDPSFGTTITRVSEKESDGFGEIDRLVLMPEYSRSDPLNCDGSKILLTIREFSLYIYNSQTFALEKRLSNYHGGTIPAHTEGGNEPRWDDEDPNVFYYVSGMGFYKYDLRNDTSTLIRNFSTDFPDGYWVGNDAEGEPSMDRRYWGFFVRGLPPEYPNYVKFVAFTYDMVEDIIIGTLPQDNQYDVNPGGNTITISPFGKRVIIEHFGSTPTRSYNLDFTNPVDLGLDGHSDLAIDAENNEVHVIKDDQYDWIAMLDVNTGQRTNLLKLPMTDSWDIEPGILISGSNYNKPGWVVISTYAGDSGAWAYNQIFLLELKEDPMIWRLAHTQNIRNDYWTSPKAAHQRLPLVRMVQEYILFRTGR
jgi:hypothetical protein